MQTRPTRLLRLSAAALVLAIATLLASGASAGDKRKLCVFDPSGANGDIFTAMKDFQAAAAMWGVDFEMAPYTKETTAVADFKANKCHAVMVTGTRARAFNKASGTIEAMGALPSYKHLESLIGALAKESATKLLRGNEFETALVLPGGAVYLFVRDNAIRKVEDLAGKKIATLDHDEAAKVMVRVVGAIPVSADETSFAAKFNNGEVDACYSPAVAYAPLELDKGLAAKGGIAKYPIAQFTFQVIIRSEDFPADFGTKAREWGKRNFDSVVKLARAAEKDIPAKYWVEIPKDDQDRYDRMFQEVRVRLRDQEKVFDKRMLTAMRKIRCSIDGARAECAMPVE
jgi:ABC-type amino acid transport substrate-binding protein